MRVVLDTNVVISGLGSRSGPPGQVFQHWQRKSFELITSPQLVAEYRTALGYPKVRAFLRLPEPEIEDALTGLGDADIVVDLSSVDEVVIADPDDDIVVATAVAGEADYIISGDRHLLDLGEHAGISVITPAVFLAILERDL